ncbi:MAG: MarR family transcriptional regulator [Rhizobiaceae bacterium]|nr:MarR family transcriptional regulator [Rhizobiaceae bacterium]
MDQKNSFELTDFLPYLLNQAAEVTSRDFEPYYKKKYGMLRTEWRVLFHLGQYGTLTAKDICQRARIHKTKVSRAVHALEQKRYLSREQLPDDRRHEKLDLTRSGQRVFKDLETEAQNFDRQMMTSFTEEEYQMFRSLLARVAKL